jgi:apolipoprotein N-acyltransferase
MTHLTAFIQSGSIVGVFGISVIVLSASLIPFLLMNKRGMLALVIVCIISTNYLFGWLRLRSNPTTFTTHKVRIVQPNILQENKWSRQRQVDNLMRVIELSFITPVILSDPSHGEGSRRIQAKNIISLDPSPSFATQRTAQDDGVVVVWPESATGIFSLSYQSTREFIAQSMPKGSLLAAGSTRVIDGSSRVSMFLMNAEAEVLDIYDKVHLVPFGEYVPLRQWIPFNVKKITHGFSDFLPGKSHKVIKVGTFPGFRPLICYESFFANEILPQEGYPEALINITNDSWYGDSPGPHQHLDISIFRAVEYGVPMIRAANTGMSAITDSYGRTLRKLELNTSGVLDAVIAKPVPNRTLYSLHGDTITLVICIALIGLSFRSNLRKHS